MKEEENALKQHHGLPEQFNSPSVNFKSDFTRDIAPGKKREGDKTSTVEYSTLRRGKVSYVFRSIFLSFISLSPSFFFLFGDLRVRRHRDRGELSMLRAMDI